MEVGDVLQTLDYKTAELDPFFKDFNVLRTEGADKRFDSEGSSPELVIIIWLIGI